MTWIVAWLLYALVGIVAELYCVFSRNGSTISEETWKFVGIKGYVVTHTSLRRMVLVGGLAILSVHLLTGYI